MLEALDRTEEADDIQASRTQYGHFSVRYGQQFGSGLPNNESQRFELILRAEGGGRPIRCRLPVKSVETGTVRCIAVTIPSATTPLPARMRLGLKELIREDSVEVRVQRLRR